MKNNDEVKNPLLERLQKSKALTKEEKEKAIADVKKMQDSKTNYAFYAGTLSKSKLNSYKKLSKLLINSFCFSESELGFHFWYGLYYKLGGK